MTSKHFIISKRKAEKRLSSTLQHKLRIVMKCYTITNFIIDIEENTFNFNKTNRVRGIVIKDPKNYNGSYVLEEKEDAFEDEEYSLTINIG